MQTSLNFEQNMFYPTRESLKKEIDKIDDMYLEVLYRVISAFKPIEDKKPSASFQKSIDEIERGEVVHYRSDDPIAEMMRDLKS